MIESGIQIKNLYKVFGARAESALALVKQGVSKQALLDEHQHVLGLNNINLELPAHGISVIMGLSGSGKSTLIRHVNRLIEPTAGEVYVNGEDVLSMSKSQLLAFRRYQASMVFQKFGLHVHKTIAQNVAYGLTIQGKSAGRAEQQSHLWIERVGLAGFEDHYPAQLSGGMQQRVGLARALATDVPVLLMDEAFSALDPLIRTDMQNILLELQSDLKKTIMFITHDLDEALLVGDNISILRDGSVIQQGDPQEVVIRPADEYICDFVQHINRGRVIKLKSLMRPEGLESVPELMQDMVLDDALQCIVEANANAVNVVDAQGKIVGSVSLRRIAQAMARPDQQGESEARYK